MREESCQFVRKFEGYHRVGSRTPTIEQGSIAGRFFDHADFAPVLARAKALGVPVYIHPNWPSPRAMEIYYDGLGDALASRILSGPGYGWHQEVVLQCLHMIVGGVFDRCQGRTPAGTRALSRSASGCG